jgi:hypothetical protein
MTGGAYRVPAVRQPGDAPATMNPSPPVRGRDAAATRSAILLSARRAFAKSGYDGAGVREIAGEAIAAALIGITKQGDIPLEGFQIMLRSASNERAAELAREQIERHHQKNIAASLSGALTPQRTGVMLALIAGFQMMRQMVGLSALAKAEPKALVRVLGPLFEQLIR